MGVVIRLSEGVEAEYARAEPLWLLGLAVKTAYERLSLWIELKANLIEQGEVK